MGAPRTTEALGLKLIFLSRDPGGLVVKSVHFAMQGTQGLIPESGN